MVNPTGVRRGTRYMFSRGFKNHGTFYCEYHSSTCFFEVLGSVFQKLDSVIHWINHHLVDNFKGEQLQYDRDLSTFEQLGPVISLILGLSQPFSFVNNAILISFAECYVNAKLHCYFVLLEWIESTQNVLHLIEKTLSLEKYKP